MAAEAGGNTGLSGSSAAEPKRAARKRAAAATGGKGKVAVDAGRKPRTNSQGIRGAKKK
jgi:hypothetical protein